MRGKIVGFRSAKARASLMIVGFAVLIVAVATWAGLFPLPRPCKPHRPNGGPFVSSSMNRAKLACRSVRNFHALRRTHPAD